MGKKIKTDKKEKGVVQADSEKEESITVLQKKKNAKKLKKQTKTILAEVMQNIEKKQVISAVKALQKFHKKTKE